MAIRVLSIDGGGMRGIIPLLILHELEQKIGRAVGDEFQLIAGTSTGGLIACALSLKEAGTGKAKFSAEKILKLYEKNATKIFPKQRQPWSLVKSLFRPVYGLDGLEATFQEILGDAQLSDCRIPLLVTAYDVRNFQPIYFSSRFVVRGCTGFDTRKNLFLTDICRATSAAPTYLPSHVFDIPAFADGQPLSVNCVDGGVFLNNPALGALTELMAYRDDPIYESYKIRNLDDIRILSLGTGLLSKSQLREVARTAWGRGKWILRLNPPSSPLVEVMMQANTQAVEGQMKHLIGENHERVNLSLQRFAGLDDASAEAMSYWKRETYRQVINNATVWNGIERFMN